MTKLKSDVAIIGAGIGGLCAGALLARSGYRVVVLERLPILGGRYTSVQYRGFTVPTASWMVLYGTDDPVYRTLEEVGAPGIEMRGAGNPMARYRINGSVYDWPQKGALRYLLGVALSDVAEADRVMSAVAAGMKGEVPPETVSFRDWLLGCTGNEAVHGLFRAQIATWCGMNDHELPAVEFFRALKSFRGKSDFGIPRGGLRDVIAGLSGAIRRDGGLAHTMAPAKRIVIEDGQVRGVMARRNGESLEVEARAVISNAGPRATLALIGEENFDEGYREQVRKVPSAVGMDYLFVTDEPLLDFPGTLYTTDTRRKEGWSVPTLVWPEHARAGKHLLHAFAVPESTLDYDPEKEQNLLLQDLNEVFPDFERAGGKLLLKRNFCGEWPVTRAWQGKDMDQATPISNLYNVGDGVKPEGWIVGSGAAESGRLVARMIMDAMHPG